jgi:hypothetical protein
MKLFGIIILIFYSFVIFGQTNTSRDSSNTSAATFSLSFSTFNHAEWDVTTYLLTDRSIKVMNRTLGKKSDRTIFSKNLSPSWNPTLIIDNLRLGSLNDFYFNYCVLTTSGNEYFLDVKANSIKKHISLHHYYLKQLDDIIQLINSQLPKKYQYRYLSKNEKQDCKIQ